MKNVLWIVNTPLNVLGEKIYGRRDNGVWMSALLDSFIQHGDFSLTVATAAKVQETVRFEEDGVIYYAVPDAPPILYDENKPSNIEAWRALFDTVKPDLIQIWGTEFTHGLCALRQAKEIPSVIYMQGYLVSIARHYLAGMTHRELKKSVTFRDIIKRDSIEKQQKKYYAATKKEQEMFRLAGNIICENDWCENSIKAVADGVKVFRCPLSVNAVFSEVEWSAENAEPHSIICNASGYPLKGLHMLLRAMALLKAKYPDIRLYVPGEKAVSDGSAQWFIRKRGYTAFIERLIKELDLGENIVWLGSLPQKELARQYAGKRVFVLCSAIENHSSSLKEAMMTGTPCVASAVGGVPEYVNHKKSGFLYRFEEYDVLAEYISRLFEDDKLAQSFSERAKNDIMRLHGENDIYETVSGIYRKIING